MKHLVTICLLIHSIFSFGEGTKELGYYFKNGKIGGLILATSTDGTYSKFGQYGAGDDYKIKVRITDIQETMYLGMQVNTNSAAGPVISNMPYRIVDPNGVVVFQSTTPAANQIGFIASVAQNNNGPNINGVTNGYNPIVYQPLMTGDYVIEYSPAFTNTSEIIPITYFDITVTGVGKQVIKGRLHSKAWQLSQGDYVINPFNATVYPYHPNGVIYAVKFDGMLPYVFSIYFNGTGTDSTGFVSIDRQSKIGFAPFPEYEVFLNPPDPAVYPVYEQDIKYTASIKKSDCESSLFCIEFSSKNLGVVDGFIDFNGNSAYEPELGDILFADIVDSTGATCIAWDGKDGLGNTVDTKNIQIISQFGSGTMHLPLYDIEHNPNGYVVKTYGPTSLPDPLIFWDDRRITKGEVPLTSTKVNLSGCSSASNQGCHQWTGRGEVGTKIRALQETINTWWYSDIKYDTLEFTYTPNYPVRVSFDPDTLITVHPNVCKGDTVDFFVYNNKENHWDTTVYKYYWFANYDFQDTLLLDLNKFSYVPLKESTVHLFAEFKTNKDCVSHDSIPINIVEPIKANVDIVPMLCTETTTSATITIIDDGEQENPVITWKQFPGFNNATKTGLLPGSKYEFSIKDDAYNKRCAFDSLFKIEKSTSIKIKAIVEDSTICYESTGDISIIMEDQSLNYSYSWGGQAFQNKNTLNNLSAANYTVRVRNDSSLCVLDTIIPVKPIPFVISGSATPDVCDQAKGTTSISIPSTSLRILWEDSSKTLTRSNLLAGVYTALVFSDVSANCSALDSFEVVNSNLLFEVDTSFITPTLCYDSSGIAEITMKNYPSASFEYSWNGAPYQNLNILDRLISTKHLVSIRDKNSGCLIDTSVFVPELPFTFSSLVSPELCGNKAGVAEVFIPSTNLSILWNDSTISAKRTGLSSGTYTVNVYFDLNPTCSADTILEVVDSTIVFEIDNTISKATLCYDSTGTAEVVLKNYPAASFEYSWNNTPYQVSSVISKLVSADYPVVIRDKNSGCLVDTTVFVPELPFVIGSVVSPELCGNKKGDAEVTIPSNNLSILWEDNSTNAKRTGLSSGTYAVNVYFDSNPMCSADTILEVTDSTIVFEVDSTILGATLCYDSTGVAELFMKQYSNVDFVYSWNNSTFTKDTRKENLLSGDYSVSILDNISMCSTNTIIKVPSEPFKLSAQSRPEICLNALGSITVELPSDKINVVWADTSAVALLLRENLSQGTFSFTASSDLNPGSKCSIDSSITIKNEVHIVDIEDVVVKNASCINPNGEGEIVINSDTVSYVINWQDLGVGLSKEFKRTSLAAGEYFATVYEEGTNCKADTSFIIIPKGFDIDVNSDNTICNSNIGGIEVDVTEGDEDEFTITWDDIVANTYKRSALDSGYYHFKIVSKTDPTCNLDSLIYISKSTNELTASFDIEYGRSLDEVFLNDTVKFINTSPDKTPVVEWRFPDGIIGKGEVYSHAFSTDGRKIIELYIEDQYGCNASVKRPLTVLEYFDCGLAMPNAFTPNSDGTNDDIGILGFADQIELRIYTRWGEIIYRSFDIKERWDGTFLNGESPVDTYIYQLDYICRPSRGKEIKDFMMGEITLIR